MQVQDGEDFDLVEHAHELCGEITLLVDVMERVQAESRANAVVRERQRFIKVPRQHRSGVREEELACRVCLRRIQFHDDDSRRIDESPDVVQEMPRPAPGIEYEPLAALDKSQCSAGGQERRRCKAVPQVKVPLACSPEPPRKRVAGQPTEERPRAWRRHHPAQRRMRDETPECH